MSSKAIDTCNYRRMESHDPSGMDDILALIIEPQLGRADIASTEVAPPYIDHLAWVDAEPRA